MDFSDQLLAHIRQAKAVFARDYTDRDALIKELLFVHNCCVASEDLLLDARVFSNSYSDSFTKYLKKYYEDHLEEERDELKILTDDLNAAQIDWNATPLNLAAIAMVGSQYYLIRHVHPVCLLGYMAIQEMDPTPIEFIERLETLHGADILKFARLHAIKDIDHAKELAQLINSVPDKLKGLVRYSTDNALLYYGRR